MMGKQGGRGGLGAQPGANLQAVDEEGLGEVPLGHLRVRGTHHVQ